VGETPIKPGDKHVCVAIADGTDNGFGGAFGGDAAKSEAMAAGSA
jgi:hypothetical protein